MSLVARIATRPPPDLRDLGVPEALAAVVHDALAKTPAERIGSPDELRRRLEAGAGRVGPAREELPSIVPVARDPAPPPEGPAPARALPPRPLPGPPGGGYR